jgi:hypothetical protein
MGQGKDYASNPYRMQFGVYPDGRGGVYDQFGGHHDSFCGVCHDGSDNAAVLHQMTLEGPAGWWKTGAELAAMALPIGAEAIAARGISTGARAVAQGGMMATSSELVPMAESIYLNGTIRSVAGYEMWATTGVVGNSYNVNILGLYKTTQSQGLRALASNLLSEASSAGASRISISGNAIINSGIADLNAATAARLGFQLERINSQTIMLSAELP